MVQIHGADGASPHHVCIHLQKEHLEGHYTWTWEPLQGLRERGDCLDNDCLRRVLRAEIPCMSVYASVFCGCDLYACMCTHV